ncbi:MAG: sigma-70 factor domain-containing protein, partial [Pseudomonadota bacterium]
MSGFHKEMTPLNLSWFEPPEEDTIEEQGTGLSMDEPIWAYMAEMKKYPRVSPERELILGKRIRNGLQKIDELILRSRSSLPGMLDLKSEIEARRLNKGSSKQIEREVMTSMVNQVTHLARVYGHHRDLASLGRRLRR